MKRFVLFLLLFLIILSSQAIAGNYADIELNVNSQGDIDISGLTNYQPFQNYDSTDFLSFDGTYWTLNLSTKDELSDVIYKIILPEDVVVNYLRVPNLLTIDNKKGNLMIVGTAHDEKLAVIVQYTIQKKSDSWWFVLFVVAFLIALAVLKFIFKSPVKKTSSYIGLTDRQKRIYDLIEKNEIMTQGELEKITNFPKSSLSRNIDSLVKKELICKEQSGMSNKLFLNKKD